MDTYRRIFAALDPEAFHQCFLSWVRDAVQGTEGKLVAIDGKTVRRSFAREDDEKALHLVSAWCAENNVVLGQIATRAKSNEITAIPELLNMLDVFAPRVLSDVLKRMPTPDRHRELRLVQIDRRIFSRPHFHGAVPGLSLS